MPSEATEHDLIYGGLEALRAAMPLALCAYIHESAGQAPLLYMVAPRMDEIDPAEAFTLFTALRETMERAPGADEDVTVAGYSTTVVATAGPRSRGLHVAGRRSAGLDGRERAIVTRIAQGLGAAVHSLEEATAARGGGPAGEPIRVSVDLAEGRARAEVAVPLVSEIRTGNGEAALAGRAVVAAVIDATDASLTMVESSITPVGDARAAMVLLADALGRRALGSALIDEDTDELHAMATAAMHAAVTLAGDRRSPASLPEERTLH